MEKFQIAKYGMMQMTALAYGILACATLTKGEKILITEGHDLPPVYLWAVFYRNYGIYFSLLILVWAVVVSYYSSGLSKRELDIRYMIGTGLLITLLFAGLGTYLFFTVLASFFYHST